MVGPVIFDTIKRYLTYCGFEVTWVVNITDVDDKLIAESQAARHSHVASGHRDDDGLLRQPAGDGRRSDHRRCRGPPSTWTRSFRSSKHLIEKGFAYESGGECSST